MDEVSLNTEPVGDDDADDFEVVGDCAITEYVGQTGIIQNPLPPAVGMEFETYDDVYYFYNCYAKEQGFGVRVSNTWYRKSREKYRGKLSCSSAGFKKKSEANRPRPETRTGCPAMIKFRLMETKRWRIIEVELDHNHLLSPRSGKFYKSHKHIGIGTKRMLHLDGAEEVQKVRLFRTLIIDTKGNGNVDVSGVFENNVNSSNQLKLKPGDAQAIQSFFCRWQLTDPNFFNVVDLNEKGCLRNLLWTDTRSRVAYRPEEFEAAWEDMIQRHGIKDHGWIQTLYEDRKGWAPVYLKEAYLSGVFSFLQNEVSTLYFEGYLDTNTPLKEFLDKYDQALRANYQLEALADMDSRNSSCIQKPRCYYEFQLSKLYTNEMLRKFQTEVEAMYSCYSTKHVSADGPITYIVKEEFEVGSNEKDSRAFIVLYNASDLEVLCVCGLFNFRGYLCRHILCVLSQSGMQEIPSQYILSRWRKDVKRSYILDHSCSGIDIKNPVHRYDDLYKRIVQVVEEGRHSQDRYKYSIVGTYSIYCGPSGVATVYCSFFSTGNISAAILPTYFYLHTNHHDMTTGAKYKIHKPLQKLNLRAHFSLSSDCEPTIVTQVIKNPHYRQAMLEEYDALVRNGTWKLVPPPIPSNIVGCKWIFVLKDILTVLLTGLKLVLLSKGSINGVVWTIMTLSVQLLSPPQYGLF
ncbi:protein FAR1-RELATED SEQUENCE 6 [Citrus sinensis]|nr:protein FAR1-RELATED SEQUENCE 6 [Citrus sinensis]